MSLKAQPDKAQPENAPVAVPVFYTHIDEQLYNNADATTSNSSNNNTSNRNGCRSTNDVYVSGNYYQPNLGRRPVHMPLCPNCKHANAKTRTVTRPGAVTWVLVAVGATFVLPLCWIPLVVDSMKQTDHFCQQCGQKVGRVKPLGDWAVKEMA